MPKPPTRSPIVWLGVPVLLIAVAALGFVWAKSEQPPVPLQDFIEYWAAGAVNADGGNPYDPTQLLPYQQAALHDPTYSEALMMWNPPWALVLVTPFGVMPVKLAHAIWLLLQLASVLYAAKLLWRSYGGPNELLFVGLITALLFAPFFSLLRFGQISGLCLLGLAGFIDAHRRGKPFQAGVFATLTSLKPHLLFAFGLVMVLDGLTTKRGRRALLGAAITMVIASIVAWLMNPQIFDHYRMAGWSSSSSSHTSPKDWYQPLISFYIRWALSVRDADGHAVALGPFWVQFVPLVITAILTVLYWFKKRTAWDWSLETPRLIFASALFTSYGAWIFDLVVLLVPVVQAAVWIMQRWTRRDQRLMIVVAAHFGLQLFTGSLQILTQLLTEQPLLLHALVYFTPATLLVYLAAGRASWSADS